MAKTIFKALEELVREWNKPRNKSTLRLANNSPRKGSVGETYRLEVCSGQVQRRGCRMFDPGFTTLAVVTASGVSAELSGEVVQRCFGPQHRELLLKQLSALGSEKLTEQCSQLLQTLQPVEPRGDSHLADLPQRSGN